MVAQKTWSRLEAAWLKRVSFPGRRQTKQKGRFWQHKHNYKLLKPNCNWFRMLCVKKKSKRHGQG